MRVKLRSRGRARGRGRPRGPGNDGLVYAVAHLRALDPAFQVEQRADHLLARRSTGGEPDDLEPVRRSERADLRDPEISLDEVPADEGRLTLPDPPGLGGVSGLRRFRLLDLLELDALRAAERGIERGE